MPHARVNRSGDPLARAGGRRACRAMIWTVDYGSTDAQQAAGATLASTVGFPGTQRRG